MQPHTSKLHCWDDVQCHLSSKHGVHYGIQRVQFCSHLTRLYSPSISQAKCCAAKNFKQASTCLFFSNGVLCGERAYRPWRLSALLIVFFETNVPANSRSI